MTAYYNEHDPFAAAWLRELIKDNWIAPGVVDERDIQDVLPSDLRGFTQCHFFAGIGIWSLAARLAGWRDDRPLWTGSCPCQPFSAAGKGGGFDDERHLWPAFHWLIENIGPDVIVGEQVASKDGLAWIDLVSADMEGSGYAIGAIDNCASGFGAPFIGQRLYWLAASDNGQRIGRAIAAGRDDGTRTNAGWSKSDGCASLCGQPSGLAASVSDGLQGRPPLELSRQGRRFERDAIGCSGLGLVEQQSDAGPTNGYWRNVDWLFCRDGRFRPVKPGSFALADGRTFRNRLAELRGAGNAINIAQAEEFMKAVIAIIDAK